MKKGEPLKNMYNKVTLGEFASSVQATYADFQAEAFVAAVMGEGWDDLELKARMRHITLVLGQFLPSDYGAAIAILDKVHAQTAGIDAATAGNAGFFKIIFPDFVEVFGLEPDDWDVSMAALERYTVGSSSEFAVRPFIIADEDRMMAQMLQWAGHEHEEVRRLASEGCRPALPWGQALVSFKEDPAPVLVILEKLKTDPSAYVRKSVANNLNDISKTHPDLVTQLAKDWYGQDEHSDWVVKHACRTLLKQGNRDVLAIFGFFDGSAIDVSDFALSADTVAMGDDIGFSFVVQSPEDTKLRLEYAVDFMKANGKQARKVFQISESNLAAGLAKAYNKIHSFKEISTRKYYPGAHAITLIVNGAERETLNFELTA